MIRNLTPHEIVFYKKDGETIVVKIPSDGVARAHVDLDKISEVEILCETHLRSTYGLGVFFGGEDGEEIPVVPLVQTTFGKPIGLPDPEDGVDLIVSLPTAQAARACGRTTDDLLLLQELVRDGSGRVIGARSLSRL